MKLYYLLISIFCIRFIGFSYFLSILFLGNLFLHLLDRLPVFINRYPEFKLLNYVNDSYNSFLKIKYYTGNYDHIYYGLISSNILIPVINLYNQAEYIYLIFIDESLLMIGNLAFKAANKLMSSKFNENQIKKIDLKEDCNNLLIDSSSSDEDEDKYEDENISLLEKIKKKNNIPNQNKFDSMSLSDLNKMNTVLSSLSGTLNNLITDIKVDKEKTI